MLPGKRPVVRLDIELVLSPKTPINTEQNTFPDLGRDWGPMGSCARFSYTPGGTTEVLTGPINALG